MDMHRVTCSGIRRQPSLLASLLFVATVTGLAGLDGNPPLAIYALSLWHYYLYALAYVFGAVPLVVFKRDAIAMKAVALLAFAAAYLTFPVDPASLAVIAAGVSLNVSAAVALGSDRTYYGHEVADLPPRRVTAFPYSVVAHPMLLGNVAAFGGTLLNTEFRQHWWPLALAHMAMNLGLLVMEIAVTPRRGRIAGCRRCRGIEAGAGLAALGAVLGMLAGGASPLLGASLGAAAAVYAQVLYGLYVAPTPRAAEANAINLKVTS